MTWKAGDTGPFELYASITEDKKKTADEEMYKTMRQNLMMQNIKRRKETYSIMLYITACNHRKSKHEPIFVYILKLERINQIYQESRDL